MWYALVVAAVSLVGAAVPLRTRPGHAHLQLYLSLAAGALLGAALFHLLPESSHFIKSGFGLPAVAGILVVFLLQRYVAPHSHEAPVLEHTHDHAHEHANTGVEHRLQGAGPFLRGLVPIFALSVHSFFDGVAIGAAVGASQSVRAALTLSVFFSVLVHKPLDGLSVSVLLINAGTRRSTLWLVQAIYAALVPIGAAAFLLTRGAIMDEGPLIGYTLAFSAGTFLSIALSDLLPELHFHRHDRLKLTLAMVFGIAVMFVTSLFGHAESEHDEHEHHEHAAAVSLIAVK